jgi:hypothetical protein
MTNRLSVGGATLTHVFEATVLVDFLRQRGWPITLLSRMFTFGMIAYCGQAPLSPPPTPPLSPSPIPPLSPPPTPPLSPVVLATPVLPITSVAHNDNDDASTTAAADVDVDVVFDDVDVGIDVNAASKSGRLSHFRTASPLTSPSPLSAGVARSFWRIVPPDERPDPDTLDVPKCDDDMTADAFVQYITQRNLRLARRRLQRTGGRCARGALRANAQALYCLIDDPSSSVAARVISIVVLLLIVLSSASFVAESMPQYHGVPEDGSPPRRGDPSSDDAIATFDLIEWIAIVVFTVEYVARILTCVYMPSSAFLGASQEKDVWTETNNANGDDNNDDDVDDIDSDDGGDGGGDTSNTGSGRAPRRKSSVQTQMRAYMQPSLELRHFDTSLRVWERRYVLRELSSLQKVWRFCSSFLNVVDLVSILPFYIGVAIDERQSSLTIFRVLRLARVFRVFKMGRYNAQFTLFARVMQRSRGPLSLMIFCVTLAAILFGTIIYEIEAGSYDGNTGSW